MHPTLKTNLPAETDKHISVMNCASLVLIKGERSNDKPRQIARERGYLYSEIIFFQSNEKRKKERKRREEVAFWCKAKTRAKRRYDK